MLKDKFSFTLLKENGKARLGQISTSRGQIDTPAFMPVGTQGTVKSIFVDDILKTNTQIILGKDLFIKDFDKQLVGVNKNWTESHIPESQIIQS